jgi:hypothetical protein
MGGVKSSRNKKNKEACKGRGQKLRVNSDNWRGVDNILQNLAADLGVFAQCLSTDKSFVRNSNHEFILFDVAKLATSRGHTHLYYEFFSTHSDLGDILIRAQDAQCIFTRCRMFPSDIVNRLHLSTDNAEVQSVCMQIIVTQQKFIDSCIQNELFIHDTCFIAFCGNNYCTSAKKDIVKSVERMLTRKDDSEFSNATIECVICFENRQHFSTLWTCKHLVCEICCMKIGENKQNVCPLCRSNMSTTKSAKQVYSEQSTNLLKQLRALENRLLSVARREFQLAQSLSVPSISPLLQLFMDVLPSCGLHI